MSELISRPTKPRRTLLVSVGAGLVLVLIAAGALSHGLQGQTPAAAPGPGGMPDLVGALKASPGCLGVETAQTGSGKNVIFAWFENREAVVKWYYSPVHASIMKAAGVSELATPLDQVPADFAGPIMTIASITPPKPGAKIVMGPLPVSQIAIELYAPLPGGAYINGRFAPDQVKVEDLKDYTPEEATAK